MNEYVGINNKNKDFVIGAFRSRQQVLMFIREINMAGANAKVINTPHEIKIGCGLSAAFDHKHLEKAKNIIRLSKPPSFVGFYMAHPEGVRLKISPLMSFII